MTTHQTNSLPTPLLKPCLTRAFAPVCRLLLVAVLTLTALTSVAGAKDGTKPQFDIPAGEAADAFKQFSAQSGEQLLFSSSSLKGVKTNAVKGTLTSREALDLLVADTGLVVRQDDKTGAYSIRKETSEESKNANRAIAKASDRPEKSGKVEGGRVELDKLEVTGSRIRVLLGEATPNAVVTYTRADLDMMGVQSFSDLARYVPQLSIQGDADPETQGNFGGSFRGVSTAFRDLRGLGVNYSLVLVNGRRLPRLQQYDGFGSQNLNAIPMGAVERIEILPSGASAIYGTNAVTGVINFILRKDHEATELLLSYRNTFESDTGQRNVTLNFGRGLGKFSYSGSLAWSDTNSLAPRDRWWNASADMTPYGGTDLRSIVPSGSGTVRTTNGSNLPGLTTSRATIPLNSDGVNLTIADFANSGAIPEPTDTLQYVDNATSTNKSAILRMEYEWRPWAQFFASGRWGEKTARRPGNYTLPLLGSGSPPRGDTSAGTSTALTQAITLPAGYVGNPFGVPIIVEKIF